MKKCLLLVLSCLCLTGCEMGEPVEVSPTIQSVQIEYSDFKLAVDSKTKIVYIDNDIVVKTGEYSEKIYHIYTPYLSDTGRACRFVDGRMYEIIVE